MSDVQRFDKDMDGEMEPVADGEWVRYSDYRKAQEAQPPCGTDGASRAIDLLTQSALPAEIDPNGGIAQAGCSAYADVYLFAHGSNGEGMAAAYKAMLAASQREGGAT